MKIKICVIFDNGTDETVLVADTDEHRYRSKIRDEILLIDKKVRELDYPSLISDYLEDIIYTDAWFSHSITSIQRELEDIVLTELILDTDKFFDINKR